MALLNKLSIKWKLSIALIATGITLVGTYVWIAKQVFENDKISYVFDAQNSKLESAKATLELRLQKSLLVLKTISTQLDWQSLELRDLGKLAFEEESTLLAFQFWSEASQKSLFQISKVPDVQFPIELKLEENLVELQSAQAGKAWLAFKSSLANESSSVQVRSLIDLKKLYPNARPEESFALVQNNEILITYDQRQIPLEDFSKVAAARSSQDTSSATRLVKIGKNNYLVSELSLNLKGLRLVALTPEAEALGALSTLFNRSLVFLLFSLFGLILISLLLSRGLTANLRLLTEAAQKISLGHFDLQLQIQSEDEMGLLAKTFIKMSLEIKRLLRETQDKVRMEEELKTTRFVQEKLFPTPAELKLNHLELHGTMVTSTECGGDWWHYFVRGDDVYIAIADATGHGTPAALITAAARAVFSSLHNEEKTLPEMLIAWDQAVASCARGEVMMTGLLFKINSKTGVGHYVNAAHESPMLFASGDGKYNYQSLLLNPSFRIGENKLKEIEIYSLNLANNEILVLYTDGLFSVTQKDGSTLSERRLGRQLAKSLTAQSSAPETTNLTLKFFNEFKKDQALPDDISIVSIKFNDPIETVSK